MSDTRQTNSDKVHRGSSKTTSQQRQKWNKTPR
jgi:hypothetical protein